MTSRVIYTGRTGRPVEVVVAGTLHRNSLIKTVTGVAVETGCGKGRSGKLHSYESIDVATVSLP